MNLILDSLGRTPAWLIENILASKFVVDLGVVTKTDQETVDVRHLVIPQKLGQTLGPTQTAGVEVVWPFPGSWQIAVGDVVLLLGAKDFVKSAAAATPKATDVPWHYTQETMKAVPLYSTSKQAQIQITAGNLFRIANAATNLRDYLKDLVDDLHTFSAGLNTSNLTAKAAALEVALLDDITGLDLLLSP